jgi:hypothetical protein
MISTRLMPRDNTVFAVPGHAHVHPHERHLMLSRLTGRQHTLTLTGPVGAGDDGYMGRDLGNPASMRYPYNASPGMFHRLHEGPGR